MIQGDRNTSFYHVTTLMRRKRNKIMSIKDYQGEWINDQEAIMVFIQDHFQNLFSSELSFSARQVSSHEGPCPCLSNSEAHTLSLAMLDEEIRHALWSLKPCKSPGPDGIHAGFYQRFWPIVSNSVLFEDKEAFRTRKVPPNLNQTLIALIPKIKVLGRIIEEKCASKVWNPVKASNSGPAFSHLFFANDLLLFAKANTMNCSSVREAIEEFCSRSRQKINNTKSKVFFSPNIASDQREELCDILGFHSTSNLGTYLGFPLRHVGSSNQDLNFVVSRVEQKLAGWEANLLSFAGRNVLIRVSLNSIPSYVMQSTLLPARILDKLDRTSWNLL
ncbi:hypothetical protein SO802_009900 [Lithocarpus litseifolius]|uniref:Reverse transcriptase n=1 Tax=Lithocarpus litseifolius TaxID=425828 RepID=A0AAW2DFC2_9ROSI